MKAVIFIIFTLFILTSCEDKVTEKKPVVEEKSDFYALSYIPAEFQFLASVDMLRTMKIPGLSDRLRYEAGRKPSLQIIPIDKIKHLYLSAGSGEDTENKGGVFIAQLKENYALDNLIEDYKEKFKNDKDVIVETHEFKGKLIYSIRDKKQKLAVTQLRPDVLISGPQDKVILALKSANNNIGSNPALKKLMKYNPDDSVKIYLLSSENIGTILQQLQFFDQLVLTATPTDKGGKITLNSICKDSVSAEKAKNALLLVQTVLMFKIGSHASPDDLKVEVLENVTTGTADLKTEALNELFIKK